MTTVEFVAGTRLRREADRRSDLPMHRNGPPGTFVIFPDGLRVSLPTDQILAADDEGGAVVATFGGMQFAGADERGLIFHRVRELHPEDQLSPGRSHTMILSPEWVAIVRAEGRPIWTQVG